ncbi:MAG TPA: glycosyl hydrolase family 28 protein [bacterium]|nr:glycosyl hydrolase family 28 protein [bacterium]
MAGERDFCVTDFGARGGGPAPEHPAFQRAIDACVRAGGGRVRVPAGRYLCGGLTLGSGLELRLEAGAVIRASTRVEDYAHLPLPVLFYARDSERITLRGPGRVDGQATGQVPWPRPKFRRRTLYFDSCRSVRVEEAAFENSDSWTLHFFRCERVEVRKVEILNDPEHINSDGIDPDSSRDVIISDCHIRAGDDCVVLKSNSPEHPCENIVVTGCRLETTCSALKLGTESRGAIRQVSFNNCVITNTPLALACFMKDGGCYEDVLFEDIRIETADRLGHPEWPIFVDLNLRTETSAPGRIRNLRFRNLEIVSSGTCLIQGLRRRPVEALRLQDILFRAAGPVDFSRRLKMNGGRQEAHSQLEDYARTPAYFILANVDDFGLENLRLESVGPELPAGLHDLALLNCRCGRVAGLENRIRFTGPRLDPVLTEETPAGSVEFPG